MSEKKKVNWKDKEKISDIVRNSSGYNDVLKKLGIKPVSSNSRTLKKYIEKYKISTQHFAYVKSEHIEEAETVSTYDVVEGNEPWFKIVGTKPSVEFGIYTDIEWNEAFIEFLKNVGIRGESEEDIIGLYMSDLYRPLGERMISKPDENNNVKTNDNEEPFFIIEGVVKNAVQGVRVETSWNSAFIKFYRKLGYLGATDEEIFGKFLISNITNKTQEQEW